MRRAHNIVITVEKHEAKILAVVIAGPTAVGKTGLAVKLAEALAWPIISFDSRQFYRELAIGSAPPSAEELARAPHYFIADRSLHQPLNAAAYSAEALDLIASWQGQYPGFICVGGSGLYLKALIEGLDALPAPSLGLRQKLQAEWESQGLAPLIAELQEKDPQYAAEADLANPRRILRALEVIRTSGRPYSAFRQKVAVQRPFRPLLLGLERERSALYERIDQRSALMLEQGLEAEARALYPWRELSSLQTVGYREWWPYFEDIGSRDSVLAEIQKNSRRYAKRQLTWFRHQMALQWFQPEQESAILRLIAAHAPTH